LKVPIVDVFATPYYAWETRRRTYEEARASGPVDDVRVALRATVRDAWSAAKYMAHQMADNALESHVDAALAASPAFAKFRQAMPSTTPPALTKYQNEYPFYDPLAVEAALAGHGAYLDDGQALFHAGHWPGGHEFVTDRPFSTSYCPQVALRNVEHNGKAANAGFIDLMVVRTADARTPCFGFRQRGTRKGHEKEVLFAAGARLTLRSRVNVRDDYPVGGMNTQRTVPLYVLEVNLS
jgi:hypothetical protein